MPESISAELLSILRCPATGTPLRMDEDFLVNADGTRRYETVAGIPILLPDDVDATHSGYMQIWEENRRLALAAGTIADREIDEFLDGMIVPTCGNLFHGVRLRGDYPLGEMPEFARSPVLEIGCNWGRWAIGGARKGMRVIGVDIHLKSLLCASHLAKKLAPQNRPLFVVADARRLPLADGSMGGVFSYSVLQHFSQENCASILSEVRRVMSPNSRSVIQMAHSGGIRARIAKRAGPDFGIRCQAVSGAGTHAYVRTADRAFAVEGRLFSRPECACPGLAICAARETRDHRGRGDPPGRKPLHSALAQAQRQCVCRVGENPRRIKDPPLRPLRYLACASVRSVA